LVQQGRFHLPAMLLFGLSTAVGGLFHVLPTSLMLPPGVEVNLEAWFGLLALIGWLFSIGLWRQSRLASTVG
jgi:hypothetical protein